MLLKNTFEGGVNGQNITPANSGGASGNAFGYTEGARYTNAQAAAGSLSATGLGNKEFFVLSWYGSLSGNGDRYVHAKFRWTKPSADESWVLIALADQTYDFQWQGWAFIDPSGATWLELTLGDTIVASQTVTIPTGTWCRLEMRADNATPTATAELRLYTQVDGSTPAAVLNGNHANAGAAPWYDAYFTLGTPDATTNVWIDDVAASDEGWIGPSAVNAEATPDPVATGAVIPAPDLSLGITLTPGPATAAGLIPTPEVYTGDPVTSVDPLVVAGSATVVTPLVQAYKNVAISPVPVSAGVVVPEPTITVPVNPGDKITRPGQIEWNGVLLGSTTPYRWLTLEGWVDLPGLDSGNVPRPSGHGSYPGRDLAQERHVIYTALVRVRREDMQAALDELVAATRVLDDDTELPLAIRVLDTTLVGYGKITRRSIPIDRLVRLGHGQLTVQWTLSDPILHSRELASAVLEDGVWQTVTNLGNAPASPVIRITGPCQNPTIFVRHDLGGGRVDERALEFDIGLEDGTLLVIDTYYGTATIGGDPVMRTLSGNSVPIPDLVLPAGQSEVGYASALGGAPAATMLWRHSYL